MAEESRYKSRKFIVVIIGLGISSLLVYFERITGTEYIAFNALLGGAYMTANAYLGGK